MLPTTNTPKPAVKSETEPAVDVASGPNGAAGKLEPIGTDRLRALREAIQSGTYPSEADVLGGLERMFRGES